MTVFQKYKDAAKLKNPTQARNKVNWSHIYYYYIYIGST